METQAKEPAEPVSPIIYKTTPHTDTVIPITEVGGRKGYLEKVNENSYLQTPAYSFDCPAGNWYYGLWEQDDVWANAVVYQSELCDIACLIQDKEADIVHTTEDWETCQQTIRDYVDTNYGDRVSELTFSHYQVHGEDLYLYSFLYEMPLADYGADDSLTYRVAMGLRLTEHIQAQFMAFSFPDIYPTDYDLEGAVRYLTASFEEKAECYEAGDYSINENENMQISPSVSWKARGLFNPFAWIAACADGAAREVFGPLESDMNKKQQLLERLHTFPIRPVGP